MIEIHITQIIALFLLGVQAACLFAQIVTKNNNWIVGALGLAPIVIILAWAHKLFGG